MVEGSSIVGRRGGEGAGGCRGIEVVCGEKHDAEGLQVKKLM